MTAFLIACGFVAGGILGIILGAVLMYYFISAIAPPFINK